MQSLQGANSVSQPPAKPGVASAVKLAKAAATKQGKGDVASPVSAKSSVNTAVKPAQAAKVMQASKIKPAKPLALKPTKRLGGKPANLPQPTKPALLASQLLALMTNVIQTSEPRAIALASELDLSLSQMRAVLVLWKAAEPVSLGTLAEEVGISDAAAVRMVDGLLRCGLAVRNEDDHDRRIKRIALTPTGIESVRGLVAAKREGLEALAESLPQRELDRLLAALAPVVSRLQPPSDSRSKG